MSNNVNASDKAVAVILAGSGVYDGSEIHEAVLTLLYLDQQGVKVQCFAPDVEQLHVVNHLTGEVANETRNVLVESARIARGNVKPLSEARSEDFDAVIIPGGFGAAKNLCDFAVTGTEMTINEELKTFVQAMVAAQKPVGLMCISPVMSAALIGEGATCTVGNDPDTATAVETMGAQHQNANVDEIVTDETYKLVTTPAYMLADGVAKAASGIRQLVDKVIELS